MANKKRDTQKQHDSQVQAAAIARQEPGAGSG